MDIKPALLAEITRGAIVESRHWGSIAVVTADDQLVASTGDIDFVTYLRSSAKPFQAISVIISGARDRFGFDARQLALMAGSHSGEPYHVACGASIMASIDLPLSALKCGIHTPFSRSAAEAVGDNANELHNNCSGKHAGMLASALVGGYDLETYYQVDHPVQKASGKVLSIFSNTPQAEIIESVDGCSAATYAISVRKMALSYARLVNPVDIEEHYAAAAKDITNAMLTFPENVAADTWRIDTDIMRALPNGIVAKAGAEGVYTMAVLPCEKYPQGLGIAIKVDDGDLNRARNAAILGTLAQLEILPSAQMEKLMERYLPKIKNHRGLIVGEIRPAVKLGKVC